MIACHRGTSVIIDDQKTGNEIVTALEKYRTANGHYPETLNDLVPTYLMTIVQPKYGKEWSYRTYKKGESFGLCMWARRASDDGYCHAGDHWEVIHNRF